MAGEKLNKLVFRLRSLDERLSRARISLIEVYEETRSVRVTLICENTVSDELRASILDLLNRELPQSFKRIAVEVRKIRSDKELVEREIFKYLKDNCKSVSHSLLKEDITANVPLMCDKEDLADKEGRVISFSVCVDKDMIDQFVKRGVVGEIERYLSLQFCDDFHGELIPKEVEVDYSILKEKPVIIEYATYRSIEVSEVVKLDELIGTNKALYIDDVKGPMDSVYLCGEILSIRERATAAGKPFYLIEFSDRSGKITGTYFNKKATESKIRALQEGDGIIIHGSLDYFRDRLSLTIKKINYCLFPKDFVPERKPSRQAPAEYVNIAPVRFTEYVQRDIFTKELPVPDFMKGRTFVVFDTETTGTDTFNDRVTEIGAVKIVDGVITEVFGSLINPEVKIPERVTEITGIDDALVADKPRFSEVSGDIYKFFDGAVLVGHNVEFDYKFISRLSEPDGYMYYHKTLDTLELARELLPRLRNHKLGTVAEHLGIELVPHRATDDAYATAQVFLQLVQMKGSLRI